MRGLIDQQLKSEGKLDLETLVRHALVRAWLHPDNFHKPLDYKLLEAMIYEVTAIPTFVEALRRKEYNERVPKSGDRSG